MNSSVQATFLRDQAMGSKESGSDRKTSGQSLPSEASQQQRPVYTTAGTLWNPDSAKPIRPPVRRGRASIGSLGAPGGGQWGFLPRHNGGSLFHPGQAPPVVPHYAPLQQNNDRAVSPPPTLFTHGGKPASTDMGSTETGIARSPIETGKTPMASGSSQGDMASVKLEEEDGDEVPDDDAFVRKLPMKTLVNLASYKNPFQQKAQHLLRVKSNPGEFTIPRTYLLLKPLTTIGLAQKGPSSALNGLNEATAPNANQHPQSLAGAPHFGPIQATQMGARPLIDSSSMPPIIPINTQVVHSRQPSQFRSSTLATGPGAPEPLKAGPPGQRPQGPSKIESALAATLNRTGMSNPVQPAHGTYAAQHYRQYPTLGASKEAGGLSMTGALRPIPVRNHGHDGARSSKDHTEAISDADASIRNFNFEAHPGFRAATRTGNGEGSPSEASSRVATPPGFNRQDHSGSQRNSSQSTRSGSGGVSIHQSGGYNAMADQRAPTALIHADQRSGSSGQALLVQQPARIDQPCQNTAIAMDARGAQFIGANLSHVPGNGDENFPKHWGNENLRSNIPCGDPAPMPATVQSPLSFQTMSISAGSDSWSQGVENLDPYGWDAAGYHMPYFRQYPYGAMKINDQVLRESEAKIDAWFYSNTSRLGKTMDEALEERRHPKARPSPFGAIGDGRPAPKSGPKKIYSRISIEEANEMSVSEHAEPLLNLAFQAILDFKDAEEARARSSKTQRRANMEDAESEGRSEKLGSAALLLGSVSDSD